MKENEFIQKNSEKWREVEVVLSEKNIGSYQLYDILQNNADDVSVARTFYKTRNISRFVNQLTVRLQQKFGFSAGIKSAIVEFYTEKLPFTIYQTRWNFLWAFIFFAVSFVIGFISSHYDEKFIAGVLGESYTQMTEENIKSGDPMKVYKSSGRLEMTFGIMFNNITVAFNYFIVGILAGIGSVALMMFEGVRIGAFLNFFSRHNLLAEANLTIWMHGVLEISAIVIGTAAGITLGTGYIFPKTFSRTASFKKSARYALNIFFGLLPMLVVAAIIEGNITRHTGIGQSLRGFFIFLNVLCIILYFGWFPFYKHKKGFSKALDIKVINENNDTDINLKEIYTLEDSFKNIFTWFGKHNTVFLRLMILAPILIIGFIIYVSGKTGYEKFSLSFTNLDSLSLIKTVLQPKSIPLYSVYVALVMALISYLTALNFNKNALSKLQFPVFFVFILSAVLYFLICEFVSSDSFFILIGLFLSVNFVQTKYCSCAMFFEKHLKYTSQVFQELVLKNPSLLKGGRVQSYAFFTLMAYLLFFISSTGLSYLYLNIVGWNFSFLSTANPNGYQPIFYWL